VRDNNETEHKLYYKQYCKTLTKVTKEAKILYYKEVIGKSKNKMKITWNIIRKETSKLNNNNKKKKVNQSHYRPEVPKGFREVKVPRLHDNGPGWW